MSKVLVTGGAGMLGSHVVNLLKKSREVTIYDKKNGQDILNLQMLVEAMRGHTHVVHLAAYPAPLNLHISDFFKTNITGTFNVAEACEAAGIKRLVFSSSTGYYGHEASLNRSLPIGDESSPSLLGFVKPGNYPPAELSYGISKLCCEALLARYGLSKKFQVVVLRLAPMPFFKGLSLKPEKAAEAIKLSLDYRNELWYEIFNIATGAGLCIEKAKNVLRFQP
jgi:nucleoside-diphosphate-sugar epimerase